MNYYTSLFLLITFCSCKSAPPQIVVAVPDTLATGKIVTSYRPLLATELSDFRGEHDSFFRAIGYTPRTGDRVSFKKARIEIVQGNKQTSSRGGVVATDSAIVTSGKKQRVETVNKDVQGDYTETGSNSDEGVSVNFRWYVWVLLGVALLLFVYFLIKT